MKLKLASLLFSQAAIAAVSIDKNNYKQYLCGSELFQPVSVVSESVPKWQIDANVQHLNGAHQAYCEARKNYEEAVSKKANHPAISSTSSCAGDSKDRLPYDWCVEKTGIQYANVCESLRDNKKGTPVGWNAAVPNLKECNSFKR